jgi:hypothetical protein
MIRCVKLPEVLKITFYDNLHAFILLLYKNQIK